MAAAAGCSAYKVANMEGAFTNLIQADFSSATAGGDAAAFLSQFGLYISDYPVGGGSVSHYFRPENVALADGSVQLTVNAYDGGEYVNSAEIATGESTLYGSLRTVLKSSGVPGVCEGMFFYKNDQQEADWEILTTTSFEASDTVPAGVWATNQALVEGGQSTSVNVPFDFDPSEDYHEYRIDWTESSTTFYIDGVQQAQHTDNVPTEAAAGLWNVWSNGDPYWSAGPPTADSVTSIKSIEMYSGLAKTVEGNVCNVD
ncbi:glycoside hydrolase family 16 protein [Schizophyllum amplum]|uniref:Glycoside hydrolase family 16 protein n=1 Tax=Schizophyllum amplum TaxID=97359 RepID=A0A550CWX8_9AGAR|nr:glycoside hydrolase family 16 protein [Auriculariopsis ampla]